LFYKTEFISSAEHNYILNNAGRQRAAVYLLTLIQNIMFCDGIHKYLLK